MTTAGRFQLFYKKAQLDLYEFQAHEPVEWLLKVAEAMLGNEVQGGEAIMKALSRKGEARVNPEHAVYLCQTGRLKSYAVTLEERFDVESDKTEFFYRLRTDLGNVLYADFLDRVVTPDQLNMAMKHCVGSAEKKGDIIEMWLGLLTLLHQCEGYLDVVKGLDAGALLSGLERALLIYATSSRTTATANTKRRGTYANFINEITEQELARAKTIGMDTGAEGASSSRVTPETEGHDEFIFGMDRDGAEARLPVMSESQKSALRRFNDYLDGACLYCGAGDRSLHNCVTESVNGRCATSLQSKPPSSMGAILTLTLKPLMIPILRIGMRRWAKLKAKVTHSKRRWTMEVMKRPKRTFPWARENLLRSSQHAPMTTMLTTTPWRRWATWVIMLMASCL